MSPTHQYHQPNAPDPAGDDSESELAVELHELPAGSSHGTSSRSQNRPFDSGLPMRALRSARQRRKSFGVEDDDGEDTARLLEEGEGDQLSGEGAEDDDAPLLRHGLRRKPRRPSQTTL